MTTQENNKPSGPNTPQAEKIIFYDGQCALCHGFVKFVLKSGRAPEELRFAPLMGETHEAMCAQFPRLEALKDVDSVVYFDAKKDEVWDRSNAVVAVMRLMGPLNAKLAGVLRLLPKIIRDTAYDLVASKRYKIFGKTEEVCPMPDPEHAHRFLP